MSGCGVNKLIHWIKTIGWNIICKTGLLEPAEPPKKKARSEVNIESQSTTIDSQVASATSESMSMDTLDTQETIRCDDYYEEGSGNDDDDDDDDGDEKAKGGAKTGTKANKGNGKGKSGKGCRKGRKGKGGKGDKGKGKGNGKAKEKAKKANQEDDTETAKKADQEKDDDKEKAKKADPPDQEDDDKETKKEKAKPFLCTYGTHKGTFPFVTRSSGFLTAEPKTTNVEWSTQYLAIPQGSGERGMMISRPLLEEKYELQSKDSKAVVENAKAMQKVRLQAFKTAMITIHFPIHHHA